MAKALIGSTVDSRTFALLEEVRALRERVAELEAALGQAEDALDERHEHLVELDDDDVGALNAIA